MTINKDISQSREYEMKTYLRSMRAMYENAITQNGEVYDIAFELTKVKGRTIQKADVVFRSKKNRKSWYLLRQKR